MVAPPVPPGVDGGCAFRGNESAKDLGKEHDPFARADPHVQRGRVDILEVDDPDVAARRSAVGMDPSVLAAEDAVDQITDRVVVLLSTRGGSARMRAIALRLGLARPPGVEVEGLQPANELEQVRADLQVVFARARRLLRQLGILRSGLHRPSHLEPGLLAHRAQRLHPVARFLRAPGVHQPLDLLDRRADLFAEGGHPVERVLDGLLRARLRRRHAMVAAGGSLARIPAAVDGEVGFAAGVPIPVRRSLPVNLLEMSCVMSLGRLKPQMKDLVALVQELLSGLRDVQRLVELLVPLSGPLTDLVREMAESRFVAEHVAQLVGDRGQLLQTRVDLLAHRDALVQRRLDLRQSRIEPPAGPDGLPLVLLDGPQAVLDRLRRIVFVRGRRGRPRCGMRLRHARPVLVRPDLLRFREIARRLLRVPVAAMQVRSALVLSVFSDARKALDQVVRGADLVVEFMRDADSGLDIAVDVLGSIGHLVQVLPELAVVPGDAGALPGERGGQLQSRLHLVGAGDSFLDHVVHLAEPVVDSLRHPAALSRQPPAASDGLLQPAALRTRMRALARCFGEMQLRMLAAVVLELELRDVLEGALLAGAEVLARHHLLVRLGRVLDAGETEPVVQIPAILRQRARGGMPVPERPLQLVVALTRPLAGLADEVTRCVVPEDVGEARREIVHLRERSMQLVARSDHFVERMLRLRGLAAHPDAALDAPARRLFQRADRLARARIRHRLL